jgi:peptidoglycan/LPS O-acetylase OafA/YrhL
LFFVLSGFLIASQLFKQIIKDGRFSMREFYPKRLFRIIPIYLFVVGRYFLIPFFREKEALPPYRKFLTYTQNFNLDAANGGTFSHVWSLCVEEHFYLFLPVTLLFFVKVGFKYSYLMLIGVFLLGFFTRLYGWNTFIDEAPSAISPINRWLEIVYYPTYNRFDGLLVGLAIAAFYNYDPKIVKKVSNYGNSLIFIEIIVLSGAYIFASEDMAFSTTIFGFPLISIGFGFVLLSAISSSIFLYRWKIKSSTLIASLS